MLLKPMLLFGYGLLYTNAKPLSDIFDVCMDQKLSSSCHKIFETNPKKEAKPLNTAWEHIEAMNEAAVKALGKDSYEGDEEIRRLATRFFGIKPKRTTVGKPPRAVVKEELPDSGSLDSSKMHRVEFFFNKMKDLINGEAIDKSGHYEKKVSLACDSDYMDVQRETEMLESEIGQMIRQPGTHGNGMTLQAWLKSFKQEKVSKDSVWMKSLSPELSYFPISETRHPTDLNGLPFPRDKNGISHICQLPINAVTMSTTDYIFEAAKDGTYKGEEEKHHARLILCPRAIQGSKRMAGIEKDLLPNGEQSKNTMLESLGTGTLAFYHELWHLQAMMNRDPRYGQFPDSDVHWAKCDRDGKDQCKKLTKNWWLKKTGFTDRDVLNPEGHMGSAGSTSSSSSEGKSSALGAMAATYLSLYDMAQPVSQELRPLPQSAKQGMGQAGLFNPDNYVWFAYAVYLHAKRPSDHWSSGYCKKRPETFEESMTPITGQWQFRFP
ncbi:Hypothetical predicted protein [Lecanosticta acicola]|uniref:Lysine-specific metallo-endopeptidase domain-containing protein n=1 Tax=Lecanosticta acicola TaxID=111012 RepID=A0AAI9EEX9_9PEZI|nr:Hypothetical predicted protein [Lecanosticta acicola]